MTDTKQPEALRLADALERPGYGWHSTPAQCAAELRRLHAENTTLQQGYDAARLEIESLHAHIKGLIAERDAAYEVAMMNAKSGAAGAEAAQVAPVGEYPPLPSLRHPDTVGGMGWTTDELLAIHAYARAYVDADRAMRAQAAPAAVAGPSDAERDAARYHWLRERVSVWRTNDGSGPVSWFPVTKVPAASSLQDETDAAIDAARAQAKEGASHD